MTYKILNRLFGWDYIQWKNTADTGVARIQTSGCGNAFYWRYKNIGCADVVKDPGDVLWLTCKPEKYLKKQ